MMDRSIEGVKNWAEGSGGGRESKKGPSTEGGGGEGTHLNSGIPRDFENLRHDL